MLCEVSRIWRMPLPRYEKAESRCRLIEIQMHAIRACEHESLEKVGRQVAFDALVSGCSASCTRERSGRPEGVRGVGAPVNEKVRMRHVLPRRMDEG